MPDTAAPNPLVNQYTSTVSTHPTVLAPSQKAVPASVTVVTVPATPATTHGWREWSEANSALAGSYVSGGISALVGVLTLFGVALTLRSSRRSSRDDRKHEANEAHRDRITNTRRDVYLEAVAEFVKAQYNLGILAEQDISTQHPFTGLQGINVAASRIALVAEQDLALKARAINHRLGLFVMRAMRVLLPLHTTKMSLANAERNYGHSSAHVTRLLAEWTIENEQGPMPKERIEGLKRSFDTQQSYTVQHSAEAARLRLERDQLALQYSTLLNQEISVLVREINDVVCAIRDELGLDTDNARFAKQITDLQAEFEHAMHDLSALAEHAVAEVAKGVADAEAAAKA